MAEDSGGVSRNVDPSKVTAEPPVESDEQLDDLVSEPSIDIRDALTAALRSSIVQRAVIGIVIAVLILSWPERTDRILARLVGVGLVLVYGNALVATIRSRRFAAADIAVDVLTVAGGFALLVTPSASQVFLGRILGAVVGLRVIARLVSPQTADDGTKRPISATASDVVVLAIAALLLAFPEQSVATLTTLVALTWIGFNAAVIAITVDSEADPTIESPTDFGHAIVLIGDWLAERSKSVEDREDILSKVLFDGPDAKRRYVRFFTLMASASVIASMGVITESTAVVIGAMLIAPLMTPLMGMAMSLVMGWPRRLALSTTVAFGGIAVAIVIGLLLGWLVPAAIDPETNLQIVSRTSPTVLDLIIALAAGTAGAYALSRPDVSDSLPGVAIAISLVPPLTVVGISYSQGDFIAGNGALLLFLTNMVAILIMGGLTFVATGVTPLHRVTGQQRRMQTSISAVAALAALVIGALFLNGATIASSALELSQVESSAETWLADHEAYSLNSIRFEEETIIVTISGPAQGKPSAQALAGQLSADLERSVEVTLHHMVVETTSAASD